MTQYDVVVLGGGAAGLMCAIEAGRRGRRVLVLERSDAVGKKILISGGGRCNFTNLNTTPDNFLSANPHFCRSALAQYSPYDFVALVDQHGIGWHEKGPGQLFCDGSARQIVRLLTHECRQAGVRIEVSSHISALDKTDDGFSVLTGLGAVTCDALVVATGGLSIPKMGATGYGYDVARRFGHSIVPTRPGLVPLALGQDALAAYGQLSGVSVTAEARCGDAAFAENLLFTHRGISGPAILQLSSYWHQGDEVAVNFLPGRDVTTWLQACRREHPATTLATALADALPRRLALLLCELGLGNRPLRQYSDAELGAVAGRIGNWPFRPIGTEGYRVAEVTLGGVNTDELSSTTMVSRKVPGLYFIGEVVDVTGHLGGYNFQWAWASGFAAGQAV